MRQFNLDGTEEIHVDDVALEPATPEEILGRVYADEGNHPVIRRLGLTSGGGDSMVLAHRCIDLYDDLVHIDTGTALPGVQQHVIEYAERLGKPLTILKAGDAFRRMVVGPPRWWAIYEEHKLPGEGPDDFRDRCGKLETREERMALGYNIAPVGFPGPGMHWKAYQYLKERQIDAHLRAVKQQYGNGTTKQRVILLTGVRLDESERRKMTGTARGEWERKGNQIWVNPLMTFTNDEMRAYRAEHDLQTSFVSQILSQSGECGCLAFAAKGERQMRIDLFGPWYREVIKPLEDEAQARGLKNWQWGWGAGDLSTDVPATGPMCRGCDSLRAMQLEGQLALEAA